MPQPTLPLLIAVFLTFAPLLAYAFARRKVIRRTRDLPLPAKLVGPAVLCIPYLLVTLDSGHLHILWTLVYMLLPVLVALLLHYASVIDSDKNGAWPDFLVLLTLGLAVDLRWLEPAWPPQLAVIGKLLLLDAGLWGFFTIRELDRTGLDLRLRLGDARRGGICFLLYTPIALLIGLPIGFLHLHRNLPDPLLALAASVFTFFCIALPEEIFFRGWMQNLLERRVGANTALIATSVLFGLSHFNKRAAHFNAPYVLLATIAGIFYGLSWRGDGGRRDHRIAASAITHTLVDTVWSLFLR